MKRKILINVILLITLGFLGIAGASSIKNDFKGDAFKDDFFKGDWLITGNSQSASYSLQFVSADFTLSNKYSNGNNDAGYSAWNSAQNITTSLLDSTFFDSEANKKKSLRKSVKFDSNAKGFGILYTHNNDNSFTFSFNDSGSDNDFGDFVVTAVRQSPSSVPVPAAVWLLGSGLVGLVGFRRKL
jgi:hypothetical protein